MKKKLLNVISLFTVSLMMLTVLSISIYAEGHPSHNGIDNWNEISSLPSTSGNYCLTSDIVLTSTWNVPTGTTNLCLNGHVINANGGSFSVITVGSSATLNLYDCNETISHDGYVDGNSLWHLGTGAGTSKTITGGIITGSSNGGGVYVSGTFNMYGGKIAGNVNGHGGGIYLAQNAHANIINGIIENNNTSQAGAAVQVDGIFKMSGGTIQNNKAGGDGGGISVNGSKGTATLTGTAKIYDNKANGKGGGVSYYGSSDKVIVGHKVQIAGNVAGGSVNNVYMFANNLYITLGTGEDAPVDGMQVGVTTYSTPSDTTPLKFTTNGTVDDVNYFFSDNTNFKVTFKDDHLELFDPPVAYNSTRYLRYSTLSEAITNAESGDVIELWGNDNTENITLPDGVILYAKSSYTGTVITDISEKVIIKQDITGNFQYKYYVSNAPEENNQFHNSEFIIPNTGVVDLSNNK